MSSYLNDPIFTNARLYRDIATEALAASEIAFAQKSRPKDDGSPGHVIAYDPEQGRENRDILNFTRLNRLLQQKGRICFTTSRYIQRGHRS